MFRPDGVVTEGIGLLLREIEDPLGVRAEWNLHRRGDFLATRDPIRELAVHVRERHPRACEQIAGEPMAIAHQSEQDVLGFDGEPPKLARFVAGEEQRPASLFGIALEHGVTWSDGYYNRSDSDAESAWRLKT